MLFAEFPSTPGEVSGCIMLGALVLGVFFTWALWERARYKYTQHWLDKHEKTFLKHVGWNLISGDYSIISFDAGITWWNFKYADPGYTILGPADLEIITRCLAFKRLDERVNKLDLNSEADLALMQDAGFTVERKE
jgi:hypothetical protein